MWKDFRSVFHINRRVEKALLFSNNKWELAWLIVLYLVPFVLCSDRCAGQIHFAFNFSQMYHNINVMGRRCLFDPVFGCLT